MSFAEKYARSVNASNLMDDGYHHMTQALCASAMADATGGVDMLGSLLSRVKYADGTPRKEFESGTQNLAQLLRIWGNTVAQKGKDRNWAPITAAWDTNTGPILYKRVAEASLAFWLDGKCKVCNGPGVDHDRRTCEECKGTGVAQIKATKFELGKIMEMLSELDGLVHAHHARAAAMLRKSD